MADSGFKAVFADRENKKLLICLLNHLLPEDAKVNDIVSYEDRERSAMSIYGKKTSLDLICKGDDGSLFEVEVQRDEQSYFFERCLFYASELYYTQLQSGQSYDELRPVYLVSLLEHELEHADESRWDSDHIIARYLMTEERTGEFGKRQIMLIFAELKRFRKTLEECRSEQDYLFHWIKRGWSYREGPREMSGRSMMKDLVQACEVSAFPPRKRIEYDHMLMNERDYWNIIKTAEDKALAKGREEGLTEGLEKGREEGLKEGREAERLEAQQRLIDSARKMVESGVDIDLVCSTLGVDKAAVLEK